MKIIIDISSRYKDYTLKISVGHIPASDDQMSSLFELTEYVKERKDVSVVIEINDDEDRVPGSVLMADSPDGIYMELAYQMDDFGWDHPLILANDHLTKDGAITVLDSIFYECTDDNYMIMHYFGEISSILFPKET